MAETTKSKSRAKTARSSRNSASGGPGRSLWPAFARSRGGKLVFAGLAALIVILLDILISRNQYSLFFLLLGIELLLAFVVILLILAWQQRDVDRRG